MKARVLRFLATHPTLGGVAGIALIAVVATLLPTVVTSDASRRLLILVATYIVFSTGLQVCFGYIGLLNLGIPAFIAVGAYTYAIAGIHGLNPWLALICAGAAAGAVAAVLGILLLRLRSLYFAIAAFGLVVIAANVASSWTKVTGGGQGMIGIPQLSIGSHSLATTTGTYGVTWAFAVLYLLASFLLRHSAYGKSVIAVRDSEVASAAFAIPVRARLFQLFTLGGVMAGIGGALYAHDLTVISPQAFDVDLLVTVTVVVVLGGKESIWGLLIGAIVVVYLQNEILPNIFSSGSVDALAFGVVLVVVMMFAPNGVVGAIGAGARAISTRLRSPASGGRMTAPGGDRATSDSSHNSISEGASR